MLGNYEKYPPLDQNDQNTLPLTGHFVILPYAQCIHSTKKLNEQPKSNKTINKNIMNFGSFWEENLKMFSTNVESFPLNPLHSDF